MRRWTALVLLSLVGTTGYLCLRRSHKAQEGSSDSSSSERFVTLAPRVDAFLVPARAASLAYSDCWSPSAADAAAFESALATMGADVSDMGRQYVGAHWKGHQSLYVTFFTASERDSFPWAYEVYSGSTNSISIRTAIYDLETGDLLLQWPVPAGAKRYLVGSGPVRPDR